MTYVTKYILFYFLFCAILIIVNEGLTGDEPPFRRLFKEIAMAINVIIDEYWDVISVNGRSYEAEDWTLPEAVEAYKAFTGNTADTVVVRYGSYCS